jgi:dethiobiotin synthetase
MKSNNIFVAGIGTDVGKTVVSAVLVEALHANYWKPIQCGELENSDSLKVRDLISNPYTLFHDEAYKFQAPLSPHAAAALENINIELTKIHVPNTQNKLVIEGAGGVMVPVNHRDLMIDVIKQTQATVIVVSRHYLGCINHTLLTALALREYKIPVLGIIFNGNPNPETENIILQHTEYHLIGSIYQEKELNKNVILNYAYKFKEGLYGLLDR